MVIFLNMGDPFLTDIPIGDGRLFTLCFSDDQTVLTDEMDIRYTVKNLQKFYDMRPRNECIQNRVLGGGD